ncbi:MBL fold metallo-hydrolase [Halorussus gelatinilyticus]|uniref:MBL fold metallo-hydrolase n=1 Tax=Halorussus gelatinilyticus TaxID=2937524 RepID=A0A8U0ILH8_9EURY|nr:MBL fold metallo-hydrolase [Halorussus gelatinilyticus]UPW01505.1 MBL fold metallo-hydrolase [Halorussus gelatinilyticus]
MQVHNVTADAETFTCNAYLVEGDRTVLVDAGSMPGVVDAVADRVETIDAVVLTHQHGDHVAELDTVLDAYDPELLCYGDHPRRTEELADGDTLRIGDEEFEAIYSPGHADDHLAFVSASTLFSGDVVVYNDGAFDDGSFGRTDMAGQSRDREIESIRTILDRTPETVESMYAGHGDEFHGDVREVVERALERAERREPKYPEE